MIINGPRERVLIMWAQYIQDWEEAKCDAQHKDGKRSLSESKAEDKAEASK